MCLQKNLYFFIIFAILLCEVFKIMKILYYLFLFYIYSIIGWILETLKVSIDNKKFIDRGFLIGPYLPIYGSGAIIMLIYLTQYKDNLLTVFLLGALLCSILEYFTSYIMEKLFNARWWDYSNKKFNLNGRVCIENALLFGSAGVVEIYLIQPIINKLFPNMNNFSIIFTCLFSIVFITDLITSLNIVNSFKKTIKSIELKDSTEEFAKIVKETLHNKFFQKRLFFAFPSIDLSKFTNIKNDLKNDIKELLKK